MVALVGLALLVGCAPAEVEEDDDVGGGQASAVNKSPWGTGTVSVGEFSCKLKTQIDALGARGWSAYGKSDSCDLGPLGKNVNVGLNVRGFPTDTNPYPQTARRTKVGDATVLLTIDKMPSDSKSEIVSVSVEKGPAWGGGDNDADVPVKGTAALERDGKTLTLSFDFQPVSNPKSTSTTDEALAE